MGMQDDIIEVVDEIVDDINPNRVDRVLEQLDLTLDDLMTRVTNELKARLS
jgi:division protein CdvB (Snf7/Vps24/ESCRT-III family)